MKIQSVKQRFGIIGRSEKLDRALSKSIRVSGTDLTVLIQGESGVGKEVISKIIHQLSPRKHNTFIAINTGALPEGTINSELFGHDKGAFTGATSDRKGYFETASGGTIFLDEVGEMPLDTQAYLLRVLETGEYIRVGSSVVQKTDVRVIAATNVDLLERVQKGKFREDLYLRNVAEQLSILSEERLINRQRLIEVLPNVTQRNLPQIAGHGKEDLAEREILYKVLFDMKNDLNDLKSLIFELIRNNDLDVSDIQSLKPLTLGTGERRSEAYVPADSPYESVLAGPAREEKTFFEESNGARPVLVTDDIYADSEIVEDNLSLESMEKSMISKALKKHGGRRKEAALELGISERTLYRKIKNYEM